MNGAGGRPGRACDGATVSLSSSVSSSSSVGSVGLQAVRLEIPDGLSFASFLSLADATTRASAAGASTLLVTLWISARSRAKIARTANVTSATHATTREQAAVRRSAISEKTTAVCTLARCPGGPAGIVLVVTFNLSWVTEHLAVGGSFAAERAAALASELGVRSVVDVRSECCDDEQVLRAHGIELLHLPTHDLSAIHLEMIDSGVAWIGARLDRADKVYVHCEHGIGRSALLTWCVLVARGEEPLVALTRMKDARERVAPSPPQIDAFVRWAAMFKRTTGASWEIPTFDPIARIAYRHLVSE